MPETYTYDDAHALTQVVQGMTTTESYTYDGVGNRLSSLGVSPYTYNSSNQLTSTPGAAYSYDDNGNTTSKTEGANLTSYEWDFENRLVSVTLPDQSVVDFDYDPFGRRIRKQATATTVFVYGGTNIIEEVDESGSVLARYTMGLGIEEPLAMLRDTATHYYQADGLGSVTGLSGSSGSVAASYTYDSFGNLTASTGSLTNPFRYTAREADSETGLYFHRARSYHQGVGRFTSEDPIRFEGGPNFYSYVRNNPTNFIDPTGLLAEMLCEPVQRYWLGYWRGAMHCRLRVSCNAGSNPLDKTFELDGPGDTGPKRGRPVGEDFNPARPVGLRIPVTPPPNSQCCSFERCIAKRFTFFDRHPQALPTYHAINSNSNAFARDLIVSCGGTINFPRFSGFFGQLPD